MARIEAEAYTLLAQLGASPVQRVLTAGGGAVNEKWTAMRAAALGVPVTAATQGEFHILDDERRDSLCNCPEGWSLGLCNNSTFHALLD